MVARVLKTENGDDGEIIQTVEVHYNDQKYCDTFSSSGDDSPPLEDDRVVLVYGEGTGNASAVGVLSISQGANPGEKILYSRDSDGKLKAKIYLKNDGSIEFTGDKDLDLSLKGKMNIKIDGDAKIEIKGNADLSATKFSVNNGNLEVM